MDHLTVAPHYLYFLVGALVVFTFFVRSIFRRIHLPSLVGFLLLGIGIKVFDDQIHLIGEHGREIFKFMSSVGLTMLLFRTGLEGDIGKLKQSLGPGALIWLGNYIVSGLAGYATAYYLLDLSMLTSLFVGAAMTSTSIAISYGIWREAGITDKKEAHFLLNVAQMSEVAGIASLALLLSIVPMLNDGAALDFNMATQALGNFGLSFILFSLACVLFARYAEAPITAFFERIGDTGSCLMLLTAGTGLMIAAVAEGLGLSLAVGALFAGLVFSQNPRADYIAEMMRPIHDLFAPFFFIGIGLSINPELLMSGFGIGIILFIPAVLGKLIGSGLPAFGFLNAVGVGALTFSLIPRAEIMLIIAESARHLGPHIMPDDVFAALIFLSTVTCVAGPMMVHPFITKLKEQKNA